MKMLFIDFFKPSFMTAYFFLLDYFCKLVYILICGQPWGLYKSTVRRDNQHRHIDNLTSKIAAVPGAKNSSGLLFMFKNGVFGYVLLFNIIYLLKGDIVSNTQG